MISYVVLFALLTVLPVAACAESARELGRVTWGRDFDVAIAESKASERPVFALFQEVPGCSTCIGFGDTILSDPLFVEAIEVEFVPLAILNNKPGRDAEILQRYGEPAWNNPVVRFLDANGSDLIARRDRVWTPREIGARMVAALRAAGRPVPKYLDLAVRGTARRSSGRVTLPMPCYWSGEACLAEIDGVVATRAGWLEGRDVVELRFDSTAVSYRELLRRVARKGCAEGVFTHDDEQMKIAVEVFGDRAERVKGFAHAAKASDQKYYLTEAGVDTTGWTDLQESRANASLARGEDFRMWLSPRQHARLTAQKSASRPIAGTNPLMNAGKR